jgi:hypothetical protein
MSHIDRSESTSSFPVASRIAGPLRTEMADNTAPSFERHRFHACTGLQRSRHIAGIGTFHLAGCSFSQDESHLEIVLCIESNSGPEGAISNSETDAVSTHFMQPRLALFPDLAVMGCSCGKPTFRQHVITLVCACKNRSMAHGRMLIAKHTGAIATTLDVFELRTKPFRVHGRRLACTGQALYGDLQQQVRLMHQSQVLWQAVGFHTKIVFSSDAGICEAMARVTGVQCELRTMLAPARRVTGRSPGRQQIYEQPVLNAVCLAYARAAGSQYLALADTDDFAPSGLPRLLDHVSAQESVGGVRLFFDSQMACPPHYCPSNESDWQAKCAHARTVRRNHWKPIIIPSRTQEVAVHQFVPVPPFVRKHVWSICFSHRRTHNSQ